MNAQRPAVSTASEDRFDLGTLRALGVVPGGIAIDSRKVRPGDLFLAYPGERYDGRHFIAQAVAAGACAVLWEPEGLQTRPAIAIPNWPVPGLRHRAGFVAAQFFGEPSRQLWVAGVTGTNGKTSCSHWIAQAMTFLGRRAAVIGTLGSGFPGAVATGPTTTPDPVSLQAQLCAFREQGARAVAIEVSSHGIEQGRVNGVRFDVALFTNLTRDHLDYHGSMEAYGEAKARLFEWPELKHAVVNLDDDFGMRLARRIDRTRINVLSYGMNSGEIAGHKLDLSSKGLKLEITTPWGAARLASPLLGAFNAHNLLGVLGVLMTCEVALEDAIAALGRLQPVRGRMQTVRFDDAPLVVVDYAHTPDALEKVLQTLRGLLPPGGRLHCVFGCGGDRDRGKRPVMGEIATRLADRCVITSDNPRSEDPRAIIEEIVAGAHAGYHAEPDRERAILDALSQARPSDIVLLAGKGHETYQEIRGERVPFDDAEIARAMLARGRRKARRV
ncbi:MAG TPA: UDP-N-acetylmuramoyl-L-alanyl-D-glutamate--2,6-diaminopimelate ligase [Burkholderiales bacterium]|jgi:UDP-N-acetylmuramoyl-L-alanyl-D-glutamate--2,6-diaminopimelate ligase|nr:UDP-N-acetylmuramoyl-L-alanyl-D-glutamate--2,6-diaminopimelate ligase [Burkholderiales bacterium]